MLLVTGVALVVHKPLSRVPENTLKFVVGIMLSGFGTFWAGEGIGLQWPGEALIDNWLIAIYAVCGGLMVALLRQRQTAGGKGGEVVTGA